MKSGSAYHQHDQRDMEETRWKKENVGIFFSNLPPPLLLPRKEKGNGNGQKNTKK